jgi:Fur family transcriptional regulator, ferric uptake regulator
MDSIKNDIRRQATEKFKEYLKVKNLLFTLEREHILKTIMGLEDHFAADALLSACRAHEHHVSRATIYRTLDLLEQSGLIKKMNFGKDQSIYEFILGVAHHDHMICTKCGKVIEFISEEIEKLQDNIAKEYNFDLVNHSLRFFGLCENCRK